MLSEFQRSVLQFISGEVLSAQSRFHKNENVVDQINVVAAYAFALYCDLTISGRSVQFSKTMQGNRRVPPTDPEFFRNLHALQDFVGLIN